MGYAKYIYQGKLCGYAVFDICNKEGCKTPIDRGLAYACGGEPGENDNYCAGYFCGEHILLGEFGDARQLCESCAEKWMEPEADVSN